MWKWSEAALMDEDQLTIHPGGKRQVLREMISTPLKITNLFLPKPLVLDKSYETSKF